MKYNFDKKIDRHDNFSVKWSDMKNRFGAEDLLPMWIADMDFFAPNFITNALRERVEQNIFGYVTEPESYTQSIVNWLDNRYNFKINSNHLIYSPKILTSLNLIIQNLTKVNDKIMILQPVYSPFSSVVTNNNRQLVVSPLIKLEDNSYIMDFDNIEKNMNNVKLLILCNPHNPIGRVWTKEELTTLGNICLKYSVKIVSDEIHSDLVLKGYKHTPIASINSDFANNTITCMAPTKTFNLAGLHTSFMIVSNKEDYDILKLSLSNLELSTNNAFSLVAAESAYTYGEDWLSELLIYIEDNIDSAIDFISSNIPQIKVCKPQGTYLLWLDFNSLELDEHTLQKSLVEVGKIAMNEGYTFGVGGNGFFRMNVACPRYMVIDALNRVKTTIDSLT